MLCNEINYNRFYEMALKGETFTREQNTYLNKLSELSNGTYIALCNEVTLLDVERKASYDFIMVVRSTFKNFLANQLIDNGTRYPNYCVAWKAFSNAMPQIEEQYIVKFDFVELIVADTNKSYFAIAFTKQPNPRFASDNQSCNSENGSQEQCAFDFSNVHYAIQLPREIASKLQSEIHTHNCQNLDGLSAFTNLSKHW